MTVTQYVIVLLWAGRSRKEGSDKVWAAVLLRAVPEGDASPALGDEEETKIWCYLAVHGKTGTTYVGGNKHPTLVTRRDAESEFKRMVKEKAGASKGYEEIAGDVAGPEGILPFLPFFEAPLVMPPSLQNGKPTGEAGDGRRPLVQQRQVQRFPFVLQGVRHLKLEQLHACMADEQRYGVVEKVDDVRCALVFDGEELSAFNKNGELLPAAPQVAHALKRLGCPFVIDGGQLTRELAGHYAVFEAMLWNGQDVREWAYGRRENMLEEAMRAAGLIRRGGVTLAEALEETLTPGLALLTATRSAEDARRVFSEVEQRGGEGVVVRLRSGQYGGARAAQKYKFYPTLDAIAIGIRRRKTDKVGSVTLGLVRESDGAIIEIGHVRSGLINEDVTAIEAMLKDGVFIVLEVSFGLWGTPGITLYQPSTGLARRRPDKLPEQCSTQQLLDLLGEDRSGPIERAVPVHVPGLGGLRHALF